MSHLKSVCVSLDEFLLAVDQDAVNFEKKLNNFSKKTESELRKYSVIDKAVVSLHERLDEGIRVIFSFSNNLNSASVEVEDLVAVVESLLSNDLKR